VYGSSSVASDSTPEGTTNLIPSAPPDASTEPPQ
jgi:hypothetical protein